MAAMGVIDLALATAPIKTEDSNPESFIEAFSQQSLEQISPIYGHLPAANPPTLRRTVSGARALTRTISGLYFTFE